MLWFRFFTHGVLLRPITLERAASSHHAKESFSKSFNLMAMKKMTHQKLIISSGRNLVCDIRLVLHIMLRESRSFIFFLTVCQEWKYFTIRTLNIVTQLSFGFCAGRHCQGWSRHKLFAATKCPAAGHGLS